MSIYFPPNQPDGYEYTEPTNGVTYRYDANKNTWTSVSETGGVTEGEINDLIQIYNETYSVDKNPQDGHEYVREDDSWIRNSVTEAPSDGEQYVRKNEAWEQLVGSGVSSVNSKVGDVVLDADDVGAATEQYVLDEIAKISSNEFNFLGEIDPTTSGPTQSEDGDIYESNTTGTIGAGWGSSTGKSIQEYQLLICTSDGDWVRGGVMDGGSALHDATDSVKGVVLLSDSTGSSLDASSGHTAATPKAVDDLKNNLTSQINGKISQSDGDSRYVRKTGNESISGNKTFLNDLKVDANLQAGDDSDNTQFIEMYIEKDGGVRRKVVQGRGNGPTLIRDSNSVSEMRLRNDGGSQGHVWMKGKTNGTGCIFLNVDPGITKNAEGTNSADINNLDMLGVKTNFDSSRGTKTIGTLSHITLYGNSENNRRGFKATNYYGLYIKNWNGRNGDFNTTRGIYSELAKGGTWFLQQAGDAAWGGSGNVLMSGVYSNSVSSGKRKVVVDSSGWMASDTLRMADVTANVALEATTLTRLQTDIEPRLISVKKVWTADEIVDNTPPENATYKPSEQRITLLPADVAAIHPRLATYSWPQKNLVKRAPGTEGSDDPGLTVKVNDYEQQPIADGVDYDAVVAVLVGVVKQMRTEINELKAFFNN